MINLTATELWKRFVNFFGIGFVSLLGDVLFGYLLMNIGVPTLVAISIAFLLSLTLSYGFMRTYSFYGTQQEYRRGYLYFVIIAIGGLGITLTGTSYLVATFSFHPSVARFFMSAFSGAFNFFVNGIYNFRVLGVTRARRPDMR
jgi:putative flippase GtrA